MTVTLNEMENLPGNKYIVGMDRVEEPTGT